MKIEIQVNELDILSVAAGQLVEITLDALEGEVFPGIVTKISSSGTNSGGVTKYPVTIYLLRDERMREGMSATAEITIQESPQVCTVPADAVHEKAGKTYVYTSKSDDGTLEGEIPVETGISDSSYVEVTQGLGEGETVYYRSVIPMGDYLTNQAQQMATQAQASGRTGSESEGTR